MSKQESINKYCDLLDTVETHRVLTENALASARLVLHALYAEIGQEPFMVNGREVSILVRRGTIQIHPTKLPRLNKVKVDKASVETTSNDISEQSLEM
jgi:hypothetical protein